MTNGALYQLLQLHLSMNSKAFTLWENAIRYKRTASAIGGGFSPTGFTLIETVVYLGLLAIMLSGVIVTAYHVFESADRNQTISMIQLEGDFIASKIDWALSGTEAINSPIDTSSQLSVNRWNGTTLEPVVIEMDAVTSQDIMLTIGSSTPLPLNSGNMQISNLLFTHMAGSGINPESVKADFMVSANTSGGQAIAIPFTITSFLRK